MVGSELPFGSPTCVICPSWGVVGASLLQAQPLGVLAPEASVGTKAELADLRHRDGAGGVMHGWKLLAVFAREPCGRWFWILDRGGARGAELQVRRERCRLAEGVPPGAVGEERGKQDFQRRDVFVLDIPHVWLF